MTELSHPQPQAMGTGLRHAAYLTATIAVVVDRFLPSRVLGAAEADEATPSIRRSSSRTGLRRPPRTEKEQR